ncbi:hypothetical protein SLEP1_g26161 [Rubroshorea leprosula]|uniref:Uncharacterized protein n=1 Tax=Rubroshorea leprosula TaxID=152421 RepID=A0AAV5JVI8_9ROSI|nr:hypothetical protein SLEP1_g26161 [Rubroshorea leprosula]
MILEQIIKFDLQILMVSDCGMISSEPCAFVGPSHKCMTSGTMSGTSSDLDFGALQI